MTRTPVKSSHVKSVGHCVETNTLEIEFKDGAVFQYKMVPASEHEALMKAPSVGKHLRTVAARYGKGKKVSA